MARYTTRHGTVTFKDSAGVFSMTVGPGPANLQMDNIEEGNKGVIRKVNRGVHDGYVYDDDLQQKCSIEVELPNAAMTHASLNRIQDVIRKTNYWSTATSVDSTVWAFQCVYTSNDGTTTSTITLGNCRASAAFAEAKEGNKITIDFINVLAPVYT